MKTVKRLFVVPFLLICLFLLSMTAIAQTTAGYLEIQGSDTMVNLGQTWAEEFMERFPRAVIAVTGGGSGTGIAGMINNTLDIAQSSRDMREAELEMAARNGVTPYEFVVAQDGLAVAVNVANPINELTVSQLADIFTGRITDWADLGWAQGGKISVYSRQSNSGTYVFFNENIMDGEDWADGTMFMPGSSAINEAISQNRAGIGYFGVGYVSGTKAIAVAREAGGPAYSPLIKEYVDEGLYPIARPLYFYVNGVPEGLNLTYLQWVLSQEGQDIIRQIGFYSLTPDYVAQNTANFVAAGVVED